MSLFSSLLLFRLLIFLWWCFLGVEVVELGEQGRRDGWFGQDMEMGELLRVDGLVGERRSTFKMMFGQPWFSLWYHLNMLTIHTAL